MSLMTAQRTKRQLPSSITCHFLGDVLVVLVKIKTLQLNRTHHRWKAPSEANGKVTMFASVVQVCILKQSNMQTSQIFQPNFSLTLHSNPSETTPSLVFVAPLTPLIPPDPPALSFHPPFLQTKTKFWVKLPSDPITVT